MTDQALPDLSKRLNAIEALQYRAAMVEVATNVMLAVKLLKAGEGPCLDREIMHYSAQIFEALHALQDHLAARLEQTRKEIL